MCLCLICRSYNYTHANIIRRVRCWGPLPIRIDCPPAQTLHYLTICVQHIHFPTELAITSHWNKLGTAAAGMSRKRKGRPGACHNLDWRSFSVRHISRTSAVQCIWVVKSRKKTSWFCTLTCQHTLGFAANREPFLCAAEKLVKQTLFVADP